MRSYRLEIDTEFGTMEILPPIRIDFDIRKSNSGGLNEGTINIYNLSKQKREQLYKDINDIRVQNKVLNIRLFVGYRGENQLLMASNVQQASSQKNGTEIVTELVMKDGIQDTKLTFSSKTIKGKQNALNGLISDFPDLVLGGNEQLNEITRPKVMVGNTFDQIKSLLRDDQSYYIDNGQIFITSDKSVTKSYTPLINAETGMIGSPERRDKRMFFDTLLNPQIVLNGLVEVESIVSPYLNGKYKVVTLNYVGDYDGDAWNQSVECDLIGEYAEI